MEERVPAEVLADLKSLREEALANVEFDLEAIRYSPLALAFLILKPPAPAPPPRCGIQQTGPGDQGHQEREGFGTVRQAGCLVKFPKLSTRLVARLKQPGAFKTLSKCYGCSCRDSGTACRRGKMEQQADSSFFGILHAVRGPGLPFACWLLTGSAE